MLKDGSPSRAEHGQSTLMALVLKTGTATPPTAAPAFSSTSADDLTGPAFSNTSLPFTFWPSWNALEAEHQQTI